MGLDTHMIAGSRACSTSIPPTHPTITNQTNPHFAEALIWGNMRTLRSDRLHAQLVAHHQVLRQATGVRVNRARRTPQIGPHL